MKQKIGYGFWRIFRPTVTEVAQKPFRIICSHIVQPLLFYGWCHWLAWWPWHIFQTLTVLGKIRAKSLSSWFILGNPTSSILTPEIWSFSRCAFCCSVVKISLLQLWWNGCFLNFFKGSDKLPAEVVSTGSRLLSEICGWHLVLSFVVNIFVFSLYKQ